MDSVSIGVAFDGGGHLRTATSRADGTFDLPDAPGHGVIAAELGDRRSAPAALADGVTLALAPTSTIEGKVALHGERPTNVTVVARDHAVPLTLRYAVVAPVRADGSFTLRGVPRGTVVLETRLSTATEAVLNGIELPVHAAVVRGVQLALASSKRVVQVIVRSTVGTPPANAQVIVYPGEMPAVTNAYVVNMTRHNANASIARQLEGEHAPPGVLAHARPGDLYATMTQVPEGPASACAIALPADLADPELGRKIMPNLDKIEVRCVPIGPKDQVVLVEVPPWPRFD
jgi:hypothetical protein